MKKIRNFLCILLSVCLFASLASTTFAAEDSKYFADKNIKYYEGPTVTIDLYEDENGNFVGSARSGFTEVTAALTSNTAGTPNLYTIYIKWEGTNSVQAIKASALNIINNNMLSDPKVFYDEGFFIDGLSSQKGMRSIGTCYIDDDVEKVRVISTDLMAYFYNESYWLSLKQMNGTIEL